MNAAEAARRSAMLDLAARPDSPRRARRFLRARIREWQLDLAVDAAILLVSELTTNAVLHARTAVTVRLDVLTDRLRVSVIDGSIENILVGDPGRSGESGRGLVLVEQLADDWGVEQIGSGKRVWFDLRVSA